MTQLIINIENASMVSTIKEILKQFQGVTICPSKTKAEQKAFERAESIQKIRKKIRATIPNDGIDEETIRQECEIVRQEMYERRTVNENKQTN